MIFTTNPTAFNAALDAKESFLNDVKEQLQINFNAESNKSFEGMKKRIKSANTIAKMINKRFIPVFDFLIYYNSIESNGRLLSVFYLKMYEMLEQSNTTHRRDYLNTEEHILKIKKYALSLNKNARKCLDIVYNLMSKIDDKSKIPKYDEIVSKHNNIQSKYSLRPRKAVNYLEDQDSNFDDASDEDYVEEADEEYDILLDRKFKKVNDIVNYVVNKNIRPKRNIPRVDYTGMDTIEPESKFDGMTDIWYDESIHFDDDYIPNDEEEDDEDDESDLCTEDNDDDVDCGDVDDNADEQFVSDYYNDPDYCPNQESENDDDSEYSPSDDEELDDDHVLEFCDEDYAEETEEDDDDYEDDEESNQEDNEFLSDYYNDPDYKTNKNIVLEDDDSEYSPDENDELDDDHVLEFDDDDYAEESEEDDDDYEDNSEDEDDRQFVSDYFNDPDYNPDEDNEDDEEDEELELKAGIADDSDDEDEDYNPEDDEEEEDDGCEVGVVPYTKNNVKTLNICKRFYDRKLGKVHYRWVTMTEDEYNNKYDEEFVCEEN